MDNLKVLLQGVVGSTAYGLAGPSSDVDTIGVFAAATDELLGLRPPPETHVRTKPDITLHELGKWCRLALAGNPTVIELVWLPDDLYTVRTPIGHELISLRQQFLSAPRVRDAYLGYARQQLSRMKGDRVVPMHRDKIAKHTRHMVRLLFQGISLYTEGVLPVRLDAEEAWAVRWYGEQVADGHLDAVVNVLDAYAQRFAEEDTPLPQQPDVEAVDQWLVSTRRRLIDCGPIPTRNMI